MLHSETELDPKELLPVKVIVGALIAGPTLFLLVTLTIISGVEPSNEEGSIPILLGIVLAMTIGCTMASKVMPGIVMKTAMQQNSEMKPVLIYQTGQIVRYALLEGVALFGIVVILVGGLAGFTPSYIWLALVPYALLVQAGLTSFPSAEGVTRTLRELQPQ